MVLQNGHEISLSHAAAGSLSTTEPCRQLHIQNAYGVRQRTSSNTLTLAINDATPTQKVPTNFVLNLAQPIRGAVRPSGLQAYAMVVQT